MKISTGNMLWPPRDKVSALSHLLGFGLAVIGAIILLSRAHTAGGTLYTVTFTVFGTSMILLYLASTGYHWLNLSERGNLILRKLDHSMIYVLIAGSYTPLCVIVLHGIWGTGLLVAIWAIALGGILLTLFYFQAPRWLTTAIYIFMGWLLVAALAPLLHELPLAGFLWLLAGGIFYTIGAVIYGLKRPRLPFKEFSFHEVFHVFVLLGSACHYLLMLLVVVKM